MSERLEQSEIEELEIAVDFLHCDAVTNVFFGELLERRNDLLEALIHSGKDEDRFKIQMIDEVIGLREVIGEELQTRKSA